MVSQYDNLFLLSMPIIINVLLMSLFKPIFLLSLVLTSMHEVNFFGFPLCIMFKSNTGSFFTYFMALRLYNLPESDDADLINLNAAPR